MENQKLKEFLKQQLINAYNDVFKKYINGVRNVEHLAECIGVQHRFGQVRAPELIAEKCFARHQQGKPKVEAIRHYQGHAHAALTKVAINAARRLHRQKRPPIDYAALQVAIDLLRYVVNANAEMARMEAASCQGPFAFRKPQGDLFNQVRDRFTHQVEAMKLRLDGLATADDVVQASVGQVRAELAKSQVRVRTALNRAEDKAREQGNGKRLKQVQDCRKALTEVEQAAKHADPLNTYDVGAAVQTYYGVVNRFPWYFGLSPRRRNDGKGGKTQQPNNKGAKAS